MPQEPVKFMPFSFGPIVEEAMSKHLGFFQRIRAALDISILVVPIRYNKKRVCRATGMSYAELNSFLIKHGFSADGKHMGYEAMEKLEKWYLKKLKRFLRNGLSVIEGKEKVVYLDFCRKYKKADRKFVKSWKDIDEERVLQVFREECEGTAPSDPYHDGRQTLFAALYASYLFHTRCRVTNYSRFSEPIILFIISHRYHIFITESDSKADENVEFIYLLFNPPWNAAPYGLAS